MVAVEIFVLLLRLLVIPPATEQWRIVFDDGRIAASAARPAPESGRTIDHAWWWSPEMAPRRLGPGDIASARPTQDRARLAVVVVGDRDPRRGPAELVAAPVALWEELPEALLPAWPVPPDGRISIPLDPSKRWRLRLAVAGRGTWWTDVPAGQRTARLAIVPAPGLHLAVVDEQGRSLDEATLLALEGGGERRGGRLTWGLYRQDHGAIEARGLPDQSDLVGLVSAPEHAPAVVRGRPSELPERVVLGPGSKLSGRVVDERGKPILGAEVRVESTLPGGLFGYTPALASSSADGHFALAGLRPGRAALLVRAQGFSPYRDLLTLAEGRNDVGSLALARGRSLPILVVDDIGQGVSGADVAAGPGVAAVTDSEGRAVLHGTAAVAVEVTARAVHHLPASRHLEPPFSVPERLVLRRAFVIEGRLVGADGTPVANGSAHVSRGARSGDQPLEPGGRFALDLEPGSGFDLTLTSPETRELRLRVEAGAAGEERDLGDLRAPRGSVVLGRTVRAADGLPVAGARIWLPRPSAAGPLMAWANGDLLEARSDDQGRFRLGGLAAGPALLRIDATGLARGQVTVQAADEPVDLGDVALGEGVTLAVLAPGASGDDTLARVDLRREGLEPDRMTSVVFDGRATFRHLPTGPLSLMVLRGRQVLCERELNAGPEGGELEVECRSRRLRVQGAVVAAGRPAGPGRLLWLPPAPTVPTGVNTVVSPAGLVEQQVFDTSRPDVEIEVAPDGRFATDELTPGRWQVVWTAADGGRSSTRTIDLPEADSYTTMIELSGNVLAGQVVDRDGKPAADARVRLVGDGTTVLAAPDGSFAFTGLDPGRYVLQAHAGDLESPPAQVELSAERPSDPLRLIVDRPRRTELHVAVLDASGSPAGGAFVFIEELGRGTRLLTADGGGRLVVPVSEPPPAQLRVAATAGGAWGFTAWQSWEALRDGVLIAVDPGGSLRVETHKLEGSPQIFTSEGWNVSALLTELGLRPRVSPSMPLEIAGLPQGAYIVRLDAVSVNAAIRQGERAGVDLDR
jgi:hypothetical protein